MDIAVGDKVYFQCTWDYQGPAWSIAKLYVAIGHYPLGIFDPLYEKTDGIIIGRGIMSWEGLTQTVIITTGSKLTAGNTYGVVVKLYPNIVCVPAWALDLMWENKTAITIPAGPPKAEFRSLTVNFSRG